MVPPVCKTTHELNSILLRMGELEGTLTSLKSQLRTLPFRMAKELQTEEERFNAALYLYWRTDIPTSNIAKALLRMTSKGGAAARFFDRIGSYLSEFICQRCGKAIECFTRQELRDLEQRKGDHFFWGDETYCQLLCTACREIAWNETVEKRKAKQRSGYTGLV